MILSTSPSLPATATNPCPSASPERIVLSRNDVGAEMRLPCKGSCVPQGVGRNGEEGRQSYWGKTEKEKRERNESKRRRGGWLGAWVSL